MPKHTFISSKLRRIHSPGGRSVTVKRPVFRCRTVGGAGDVDELDGDFERSSVQPTVCRLLDPRP